MPKPRKQPSAEAFAADAAWRFERGIPVIAELGCALHFDEPGWGYLPVAARLEWGHRRPLGRHRRPPGPRSRALLPFEDPPWGFDRRLRAGPHQGVQRVRERFYFA